METPADDEQPFLCLGGCGYTLTSDLARARGYGSRCWRKLHRPAARRPRLTTPRTTKPGLNQPELPDDDQLTIWEP